MHFRLFLRRFGRVAAGKDVPHIGAAGARNPRVGAIWRAKNLDRTESVVSRPRRRLENAQHSGFQRRTLQAGCGAGRAAHRRRDPAAIGGISGIRLPLRPERQHSRPYFRAIAARPRRASRRNSRRTPRRQAGQAQERGDFLHAGIYHALHRGASRRRLAGRPMARTRRRRAAGIDGGRRGVAGLLEPERAERPHRAAHRLLRGVLGARPARHDS